MIKRKLKIITFILGAVISLSLFSGCGQKTENTAENNIQTETASETSDKKIVKDRAGNEVELPKEINKITAVPLPWISAIFAVDGTGDHIVGMPPSAMKSYKESMFSVLAPGLDKVNTAFYEGNEVNFEEVANMGPDAVILFESQSKIADKFKEINVPVVILKYATTLDDLTENIRVLGEVLGKEERAEKIIDLHKSKIKYFEDKATELENANKPKVLYLRDKELKVASGESINNTEINLAGGINVAEENVAASGFTNEGINMEQIHMWNPEIIILSNFDTLMPEDLYNNTIDGQDWSNIDAVKNRRVYKAPQGIYRYDAPCIETPFMVEWMGSIFNPDVFSDCNLEEDLKAFYKDNFNYELTQEDLDKILNTKVNKEA